jgi:putative membrane protein insertion efficiency factor
MRTLATFAVRLYRALLAPTLASLAGAVPGAGCCKYTPSCSQYALDALRRYGIFRGSALAIWRLLRCNPWSHGGVDRVTDQRLFRERPARADAAEGNA